MSTFFPESELVINSDGSIFHLHLKPEQLADKVVLVGDPGRVNLVASHFDSKECETSNREFHTITGQYKGKRITALSTGIGCDNIDIVMNELDALSNIDFKTRTEKPEHRALTLVRVGTCGGLQPNTPTGTYIASVKSIGFDGLLNFYAGRDEASDLQLEAAFKKHVGWNLTISCCCFFGYLWRRLVLPMMDPNLNEKIESFEYEGMRINNFEMESSALAGLSTLMGHHAMTCCMVIANRRAKKMETDYKGDIDGLITTVLEKI